MENTLHVVLVDEYNNIIGIEDKSTVHNFTTPLHRGFSVFLFNSKKEFLIQKRNYNKKTWGGFWSNSFCGHPQINETNEQAIYRHAKFELGLENLLQLCFISDYKYKFSINDIMENEICPIYLATSDDVVQINTQEISEIKLLKWSEFKLYLKKNVGNFTPWSREEVKILENNEIFKNFLPLST